MNERKRWNLIAPTYNEEIFDVFESDRKKILPQYINKHTGAGKSAIDFGCGNGKALYLLAPYFKQVLGLDISQGLLNQAAQLGYTNVKLKQADLTKPALRLTKTDFAFCCNVAILNDAELNNRLIRNVQRSLKKGAPAIFVIPSMESAFLSIWRLIDWYKQEGVTPGKISKDELTLAQLPAHELFQGFANINGVKTKHYTREEIEIVFTRCGLRVTAIEKIEYDWSSEFSNPPRWMKAPFPWDWLVECKAI